MVRAEYEPSRSFDINIDDAEDADGEDGSGFIVNGVVDVRSVTFVTGPKVIRFQARVLG